jgi:hypothetical protein
VSGQSLGDKAQTVHAEERWRRVSKHERFFNGLLDQPTGHTGGIAGLVIKASLIEMLGDANDCGPAARPRPSVCALSRPARSTASTSEARLLILCYLLSCVAVCIPILGLLPELLYLTPDLNDGAFHLGVTSNTIDAIREGVNPLDFWVPTWLGGYPLFHYYQPGPYLVLSLLHFILPQSISLLLLYRTVTILALAAFPPANYIALRWIGFSLETAASGAFLSCLIAAHGTYGIEMESFTWSGWGLFAQALALPLLPLALAGGWRAARGNPRTLRYATILAAAFLTHILYGYIAALSLGLVPLLVTRRRELLPRAGSLLRFYLQTFALVAFFVVPLIGDLPYHAKSLFDAAEKFDSHGAGVILTRLFSADLLDYQRLPVMTWLAAVGLFLCVRRRIENGSPVHAWVAGGFVLWVLLYFGRATWGPLIDLLPLSQGLHLERLSSGVHIFAIWLAAVALGTVSRWWLSCESPWLRAGLGLAIGTFLLAPILGERITYFARNAGLVRDAKLQFDQQAPAFTPVMRLLRELPPGRVYAGHSGNWGRNYRVGQVQVYSVLSAEAITLIGHTPYSWSLASDFQIQLQWPDVPAYNLWDIRYLLTDQTQSPPPGAELLLQSGPHHLYRLPSEGPFAIVSVPLAVAGNKETVWYITNMWTKGQWAQQHRHARLLLAGEDTASLPLLRMQDPFRYRSLDGMDHNVFDPPALFMKPAPAPAPGSVHEVSLGRQDASATLDLQRPGAVLFKATYHPGWQAYVDGVRTATMTLTPGLLGIEVPAGVHHLELHYRSGWLKAILLALGALLAWVIERHWRPTTADYDRAKATP